MFLLNSQHKFLYKKGTLDKEDSLLMMLARMMQNQQSQEDCGEMSKLIKMLQEENIPFESSGRQVCYYGKEGRPEPQSGVIYGMGYGSVCSVIYGYGSEKGLLEISGLMTDEEYEKENDSVFRVSYRRECFCSNKKTLGK